MLDKQLLFKNITMIYQKILLKFTNICKNAFNENLVGIYLHGSLAMNCYNYLKSDIDLIVIVESELSKKQKIIFLEQLIELNKIASKKGIEVSIIRKKYCKPFIYPTPYELHFSPMYLELYNSDIEEYLMKLHGTDKDIAAHFTIINNYGIVLYGKEIKDVFGTVPKENYLDSIINDISYAKNNKYIETSYLVLNLCRFVAYIKDDLYLSKQQGGVWGIEHLDKKYHFLIEQALKEYTSNDDIVINIDLLDDFTKDILQLAHSKRGL